MHLSAEQTVRITSLSEILFQGKKRITLIGGGSYLKLEEGKIEYGTTGTYIRKVKHSGLSAPVAMPLDLPAMGNAPKQFIAVTSGKDCEAESAPVFKFMPEEQE